MTARLGKVAIRMMRPGEDQSLGPLYLDILARRGEDTTAAVHFLRFRFSPEQVQRFRVGGVRVAVDHPEYQAEIVLDDEQHQALTEDLADVA